MMELKAGTLIVTDDCNFDCQYCPLKKEKNYMDIATIETFIDFIYPFLDTEDAVINFYGGEPLLAFDLIQHTVACTEKKNRNTQKKIRYSMTTNGSLLNDDIIRFLDQYKFSLVLSFDALVHDVGRENETFHLMVDIIEQMPGYPGIRFSTNSVFTPHTVDKFSESMQFIVNLGINEPRFSLSIVEEWDQDALSVLEHQLADLKDFLVGYYKKHGTIPLRDFRRSTSKGMFGCFGARDRLAVSPKGNVWGCYLFHDFFRDKTDTTEYQKYFLGALEDFVQNHQSILEKKLLHYKNLYQRNFYTDDCFCFACEEVEDCSVCPVNAATSGSIILGKIPTWTCAINKLIKKNREEISAYQAGHPQGMPLQDPA